MAKKLLNEFVDEAALNKQRDMTVAALDVILKKMDEVNARVSSSVKGGGSSGGGKTAGLTDEQRETAKLAKEVENLNKLQTDAGVKELQLKQARTESTKMLKLQALAQNENVSAQTRATAAAQLATITARNATIAQDANAKSLQAHAKTLNDALKNTDVALGLHQKNVGNYGDKMISKFKEIGTVIIAAFAFDKVMGFFKDTFGEFIAADKSMSQLSFSIKKVGGGSDSDLAMMAKQAKDLMGIFTHEEIENAGKKMLNFGLSVKQVNTLMPNMVDAAALSGKSLEELATAIDKGTDSGVMARSALGQLGINFKDTGDKAKNYALIQEGLAKFTGGNNEMMKTQWGTMQNLKVQWGEIKEITGATVAKGIVPFASALGDLLEYTAKLNEVSPVQDMEKEKNLFILTAKAAMDDSNSKERRLELVKKMQEINPDFLKGLDAEKLGIDNIKKAIIDSVQSYNDRIGYLQFSLTIEKELKSVQETSLELDKLRTSQAAARVGSAESENNSFELQSKSLRLASSLADGLKKTWLGFAMDFGANLNGFKEFNSMQENAFENTKNIGDSILKTKTKQAEWIEAMKLGAKTGFKDWNTALENQLIKLGFTAESLKTVKDNYVKLIGEEAKAGTTGKDEPKKQTPEELAAAHKKYVDSLKEQLKVLKDLTKLDEMPKQKSSLNISKQDAEDVKTYTDLFMKLDEAIKNHGQIIMDSPALDKLLPLKDGKYSAEAFQKAFDEMVQGSKEAKDEVKKQMEGIRDAMTSILDAENFGMIDTGLTGLFKDSLDQVTKLIEDWGGTTGEKISSVLQALAPIVNDVFKALNDASNIQTEKAIKNIDAETEAEKLRWHTLLGDGDAYNAKVEQLDKQKLARENKAKHDQFEKDKKAAEENIAIQTGIAVAMAYATNFWVEATIIAAILLAAGIAEIAIVAGKPNPYEKGRRGGPAEIGLLAERDRHEIVRDSMGMHLISKEGEYPLEAGADVYNYDDTNKILKYLSYSALSSSQKPQGEKRNIEELNLLKNIDNSIKRSGGINFTINAPDRKLWLEHVDKHIRHNG